MWVVGREFSENETLFPERYCENAEESFRLLLMKVFLRKGLLFTLRCTLDVK